MRAFRWLRRSRRVRKCDNCREVACDCLPMENWTDQLMGVVTPAVQVVRRVSRVPAQVQLRLPAWDHREIYSSI